MTKCVIVDYTVYDNTTRAILDSRIGFEVKLGIRGFIDPKLEQFILNELPSWEIGSVREFLLSDEFTVEMLLQSVNQSPTLESPDEVLVELLRLKSVGNELFKTGDFRGAMNLYDEGIELMTSMAVRRTPKDVSEAMVPLYLNKAQCCLKLGLWADCIVAAAEVLELDPKNVKALFRRGVARMENRQLGDAKKDLMEVLKIDPGNIDAVKKLNEFGDKPIVRMHFQFGRIDFELDHRRVPKTVHNFISLIKARKYVNLKIFKAYNNQFFQSGDYEFNDGSGGNCIGECDREVRGRRFLNDEDLTVAHTVKGLLGMANYGKNSNGSQFYVTLGTEGRANLDNKHVVFGRLVGGSEVLDRLNKICGESQDLPNIESIEIIRDLV